MNYKHRVNVISSYSDLSNSSDVKIIHFRKFISKKILKMVLDNYPNLVKISLSRYARKRLSSEIISIINERNILIEVSNRSAGRPNLIEIMEVRK